MTAEEVVQTVEGLIDKLFTERRRDPYNEVMSRLTRYIAFRRIIDELQGNTHTEIELIQAFIDRWAETR